MTGLREKRGGRRERLAQRAAKPAIDPCPPGQIGGLYKPLSDDDLRRIYETALNLLDRLGVGEVPERLQKDLLAIGATDDGNGRFHLFNIQVAFQFGQHIFGRIDHDFFRFRRDQRARARQVPP